MSDERTVIVCLCSNDEPNGFLDIKIKDVETGGCQVLTSNYYFRDVADLTERRVTVGGEGAQPPTQILLLFDKKMHRNGTEECPYLALKLIHDENIDGEKVTDLRTAEFMDVVRAIDQVMREVPRYIEPIGEE
ncbi:uncharacterized protein EDB91DRAFT_1242069 [Suillus paluster]|uniref:uncharacterized protein n=1 Tax=Suillus paluster TaxID=48578 RepID=UPI001B869B74|nr:uncharacterized protein EDB91DRAFT_1242069 [Suillus paluster]KAG1754836.1 hypothetical protein EDB91DRAFT_1242069 [Suillus paluster]